MSSKKKAHSLPASIAGTFPSDALLWRALKDSIHEVDAGAVLVRAVRNEASIWPAKVDITYRFGPPGAMMSVDGDFPFYWVYMAEDLLTAIWESQLCINDVTEPGRFFFTRGADDALIARVRFDQPLRFIDLTGDAVSKLGIYDLLRSSDHEWCQWFGCALDRLIIKHPEIDGLRYMSRKHPGHYAYAISSRSMARLDKVRVTSTERFGNTQIFFELQSDRCFSGR